jgi:hypothetical protein
MAHFKRDLREVDRGGLLAVPDAEQNQRTKPGQTCTKIDYQFNSMRGQNT